MRYKFCQIAENSKEKRIPTPDDKATYIGLEHLDTGDLTVHRWGSDVDITGQKLVMHKGDLLFGRRNTYLRRAAIAPHDGLFSAHGMILHPKTEVVDPSFFPFFIASDYFMDAAIRISVGSLSPTVNWSTLKELEFSLPPIDKQRELARLLWGFERTRQAYKRLLSQMDDLVKSQFVEMFGEPNKESARFATVPLGELTVCFDSKRKPVKEGDRKAMQGPYPYYGATGIVDHVNDFRLDGTYLLISEDGKALEFRNYDIAFIVTGKIWVNNHAHVLQCKPELNMVFLQYYIKYMDISHWVTGIDQKKLNRENMDTIPVMLPPIELQTAYESLIIRTDKSKYLDLIDGKTSPKRRERRDVA